MASSRARLAEFRGEVVGGQNDLAAEHAGAAFDVFHFEPELADDQVVQRIGPEPRIVVDLGYARLVGADAGKLAGYDLPAEAIASLIDGNLACVADLGGQMPGRENPPGPPPITATRNFLCAPSTDGLDFYVAFVAQSAPPQPRPVGRLSRCGPREHLPLLSCNLFIPIPAGSRNE